jgi:hypothetical protein
METEAEKEVRLKLIRKLNNIKTVTDGLISECEGATMNNMEADLSEIRIELRQVEKLVEDYFD